MPSDGLSNEVAQLATLFVQSILYGVYCITLAHCAAMTFGFNMDGSTSPSRFHYPTILVGLLLWMNGTLNLCLGFIRALQALMYHHQGSKIIDDIGDNWINIAKIFTMVVQVLLADWMLVNRCYKVYNKSWKILIVPSILWMLGAMVAIWSLYLNTQVKQGSRLFQEQILPLVCAFWVLTVALNIYTTSSIVYRIRIIDRQSLHGHEDAITPAISFTKTHTHLQRAIKIIVESCMIYTLTSIAVLVSQLAKSSVTYITSNADIMIIGISYNMMIIRVGKERMRGDAAEPVSTIGFRSTRMSEGRRRSLHGRESVELVDSGDQKLDGS